MTLLDPERPRGSGTPEIGQTFQVAVSILQRVGSDVDNSRRLIRAANKVARAAGNGGKIILIGDDFNFPSQCWMIQLFGEIFYRVYPLADASGVSRMAGCQTHLLDSGILKRGDSLLVVFRTEPPLEAIELVRAAQIESIETVGITGAIGRNLSELVEDCILCPAISESDVRLGLRLVLHALCLEVAEILYRKVYR